MSHPVHPRRHQGMSLLEVVAAVVISSMLAVAGFALMRDQSGTAHARICEAHRTSLQSDAELFQQETGRWPDRSLTQIMTGDYSGPTLPSCPMSPQTGVSNYRIQNGQVVCQFHPE